MIENSHEVETLTTHQALLVTERELFIRSVGNISKNRVTYREVMIALYSVQYKLSPRILKSFSVIMSW